MELKKITNPEILSTRLKAVAGKPDRNNPGAIEENRIEKRQGTKGRQAASEDVRHLNAEQDETQLRKDEEARRTQKSK